MLVTIRTWNFLSLLACRDLKSAAWLSQNTSLTIVDLELNYKYD